MIVRLTPWLQKRLASLARLVRDQKLDYVAARLLPSDHAWALHHLFSADSYLDAESVLCVSVSELWVECTRKAYLNDDRTETFRTERLALHAVIPLDLLTPKDIELPAVLPRTAVQPYRKRLRVLQDADRVFDLLTNSAYEMERGVPDERLALADRIWFGEGGPFLAARRAWQSLEQAMERWEASLDAQRLELCRDILKVDLGDVAILPSRGGLTRIRVGSATIHVGDSDVTFIVSGTRFRKDGTLGKRQESFYLRLEDEHR